MGGQKFFPKGFDVFAQQDWVSDYVRKVMTKALPAAASSSVIPKLILRKRRNGVSTSPIRSVKL